MDREELLALAGVVLLGLLLVVAWYLFGWWSGIFD
jgi:hypothetical protein